MDVTLKTDYGFLFIIISIIISAAVSWIYYRRSDLEGMKKKLLAALRFLSVFFILQLFSSPVISLFKNIFREPVSVFLIDNSQSLLLENRNIRLSEVLKNKIMNSAPGNSENLYFLFSENLIREIKKDDLDKISYEGINNFETNLTSSLYSLQQRLAGENVSAVTVISDGIINGGGNPGTAARLLNVPVNYILTGDTVQKNDLVLRNIFYNKTAFIESSVPVKIEINSYNYDRDIKVNLYEENDLIQSKVLTVSKDKNVYDISFNVNSISEKVVKYKTEIEGIDDEITQKNNFREFFIKFVNNKFKILVLAGGPGPDLAFLSEEIKKVKNFDATFLTQKSASEFYEGAVPDLSGFDSYVLIGYPTSVTNQNILNDIRSSVEKNNSSIVFFAQRNTDFNKLSVLSDKLPFKTISYTDKEEQTGIRSVSKIENEIFRNAEIITQVNSFPDIFKTVSEFTVNPAAETFLIMNKNSSPAFIIQNTDKNRSAAFLAYGFYKWRLNNQRNNAGDVLNYIITSSIIAVTDKEQKKAFTIETTKPVYSKFENVKFIARITNFDLQGGEKIKVKISGEGFNNSFELLKKDNRYFEGEINVPADGTYSYTAELYSGNNFIESTDNRFLIGQNNYEYLLTRADNSVLNELTGVSSGVNFSDKDNSAVKDSLEKFNELSRSEFRSGKNFELNINPYYLGILIFLLCMEWFFRKRNNLP